MNFAKQTVATLLVKALGEMGMADIPPEMAFAATLAEPPSPDTGDLAFPCFRLS